MPPCGGVQQVVAVDVIATLRTWQESHREFLVGGNEAGMLLGGDVRAADAAIWRRAEVGGIPTGYLRVAPVLAVEVGGQEEGEPELRAKAAWYLARGVALVWLVMPPRATSSSCPRAARAATARATACRPPPNCRAFSPRWTASSLGSRVEPVAAGR